MANLKNRLIPPGKVRPTLPMTDAELFDQCLKTAGGIVASYRAQAPAGCDPENKGGGNGAAIEEQRKAREQSAQQFALQMKMMQQQAKMASQVETPTILPAAPPQRTDEQTIEAARDQSRNAKRRFSFNSARMAGATQPQALGASTTLGGYKTA